MTSSATSDCKPQPIRYPSTEALSEYGLSTGTSSIIGTMHEVLETTAYRSPGGRG